MIDPRTNDVEHTVRIRARPETVWRYWTDPQRMFSVQYLVRAGAAAR